MSNNYRWLQFFADGASGGAEGGDGADTGVTTDAAGRSLEELGVPSDKAERFRERRKQKQAAAAPEQEEAPAPEEQAEAAKSAIPDWDSFMAVPENQQRLQAMMADRGKKATEEKKAAEAAMARFNPALELIAARYGIEPDEKGGYDIDAITKAVTDDDSYYERQAEDLGVDVAVAKQLEQAKLERKRAEAREQAMRAQKEKEEREFQLRQHFMAMQQQERALQQIYPNFSLQQELQNPRFFQLTSPEVGMSVEDAFYSIHHNEIMQQQAEAIASRARADAAASIRSGVRPRENGSSASAPASGTPDLRAMTRDQRRAYIKNKYPSG